MTDLDRRSFLGLAALVPLTVALASPGHECRPVEITTFQDPPGIARFLCAGEKGCGRQWCEVRERPDGSKVR